MLYLVSVDSLMRAGALFPLLACGALLIAQDGRFEEAKRMGMNYIQSEQYDKAAGRLEEVWEQDQSDPSVGEYLALAYLNTEDRFSLPNNQVQAFAIIHKLVANGSEVSFAVLHSHEKMGWLQGREFTQYCRGRLAIRPKRLIFVAEKGEKATQHSFDLDIGEVKSVSVNQNDRRGTFELKLKNATYNMGTRAQNRDEANLIADLIHQQMSSN